GYGLQPKLRVRLWERGGVCNAEQRAAERAAKVAHVVGVSTTSQTALSDLRFCEQRAPNVHLEYEFAKMAKGRSLDFSRRGVDHEARTLANRHIATFASCIWPRRNRSCDRDRGLSKRVPPPCERGADAATSPY